MADPHPCTCRGEPSTESTSVPVSGSAVHIHICGRTVDNGREILARRDFEIQDVARRICNVPDRAFGTRIVDVLQDTVADHEVEGAWGLPCGDVTLQMTEFRARVFAHIGGRDTDRRVGVTEPIPPQSGSGTDVEDRSRPNSPPRTHADDSRCEMGDSSSVVDAAASVEAAVVGSVEVLVSGHRHENSCRRIRRYSTVWRSARVWI